MLNENILNSSELNSESIINLVDGKQVSSFSQIINGKYAFISKLGNVFNFNSLFLQKYGNVIIDNDFNNIADLEIKKYSTPFKNGGIIQNSNYTEKEFNFKIEITSDSIENLETEIQEIKKYFNLGGKIYKKENNRECYINVILSSLEIGDLKLSGTIVNVYFLSVDPFFIEKNKTTISYINETNPINGSIVINDSEVEPDVEVIIQVGNVSGSVEGLTLEINGYTLELNENISSNDFIIFNGKDETVLINGVEKEVKGQFMTFPLGTPGIIKFNSIGEGKIDNYSLYFLYNKIIL